MGTFAKGIERRPIRGKPEGQVLDTWIVADQHGRRRPVGQASKPFQELGRSGAVQCPLDPDLEAVSHCREDGRQGLAGPERGRAQDHARPDVRDGPVGRQQLRGPPTPRRQRPVGIGKARVVPAGLGVAEQPEALHSKGSVVAVREPGLHGSCAGGLSRPGRIRVPPARGGSHHPALDASLATAPSLAPSSGRHGQGGRTRHLVVVVVVTGFPGCLGVGRRGCPGRYRPA